MIAKSILFLAAALMLANCCSLGNGCAPASVAPAAWDGLGSAPTDEAQPADAPPRKLARAKREIIVGPLNATTAAEPTAKVKPKDQWEKDQAADQDDEARLKRTLKICSSC